MDLDDLAIKHGTDKSSQGHGYMRYYERHLAPFTGRPVVLLEIGVASGASIRMWREYLPEARVCGVDIDAGNGGEDVFIGDQRDGNFLNRVVDQIGNPDVIIDDGGHKSSEQVASFKVLFPRLKSGGLYVVEDTHAFHDKGYTDAKPSSLAFFTGLVTDVNVGGRGLTGNFEKALAFSFGPPLPLFSQSLRALHFYQSLLFAERR